MGLVATCFHFWSEPGQGCIWLPQGSVLSGGAFGCCAVPHLFRGGVGVGAGVILVDNKMVIQVIMLIIFLMKL